MSNANRHAWRRRIQWVVNTFETAESESDRKKSAARKLGISDEMLRLLWKGENTPGLDTFMAMTRTYPVNPDWLFSGAEPRQRPPGPDAAQRALIDIEARLGQAREEGVAVSSCGASGTDGSDQPVEPLPTPPAATKAPRSSGARAGRGQRVPRRRQ